MIMSGGERAFWLIVLASCLGACLIRAFYEIELWRERRRNRQALLRHAVRAMQPINRPERR